MSRSRALLLPFFMLLCLPFASASAPGSDNITIQVDVSGFDKPLVPVTGVANLTASVEVRCDAPVDVGEGQVIVQVEGPPWSTWKVSPPDRHLALNATDCVQGTPRILPFLVEVRLAAHAPAYGELVIRVTADYRGTSGAGAANGTVGLVQDLQARLERTIVKTGQGSTVLLPLRVDNHGNGPMLVSVSRAEEMAEGLTLSPVEPFLVPMNETVVEGVEVSTPASFGYENERHRLHLLVEALPAGGQAAEAWQQGLAGVIQVQGLSTGGTASTMATGGFVFVLAAVLVGLVVMALLKRSSS